MTVEVLPRGERNSGVRVGQPWADGGGVRIVAGVMSAGRVVRNS